MNELNRVSYTHENSGEQQANNDDDNDGESKFLSLLLECERTHTLAVAAFNNTRTEHNNRPCWLIS